MKAVRLMAIGFQETIEGFMEFVDIIGNDVGQIAVFGLVPHVFDGIKVRGVCLLSAGLRETQSAA